MTWWQSCSISHEKVVWFHLLQLTVMKAHFTGSFNLVCSEFKVSGGSITKRGWHWKTDDDTGPLISQPNYAYLFLPTHVSCASVPELRTFPVIGNFPEKFFNKDFDALTEKGLHENSENQTLSFFPTRENKDSMKNLTISTSQTNKNKNHSVVL